MRFAISVPNHWPKVTGPARVATAVANEAARRGHAVRLLHLGGDGRDPLLDPRVEAEAVGRRGIRAMRRRLEAWRPDAVLVNELRNPLTNGLLASFLGRRRVGLVPHGGLTAIRHLPWMWQRLPYRVYDRTLGRNIRDARLAVLAGCVDEQARIVQEGFRPSQVHLAYLGTDAPSPSLQRSARPKSRSHAPVLTMVANFGVFRDASVLTEAAKLLAADGTLVTVRLVGPQQNQSRFARDRPPATGPNVQHVGPVDAAGLAKELRQADLFCYPTRYESFGLPILEAACAGVPIITTSVGVAREIVNSSNGALVARATPREFSAAIRDWLARRDEVHRAARRFAPRIGPWAAWRQRASVFVEWLETGEMVSTVAPPRP